MMLMKKLEYTVTINPDGTWSKNTRVREEVRKMFHTDGYTTHLTMTFFGADKQGRMIRTPIIGQ